MRIIANGDHHFLRWSLEQAAEYAGLSFDPGSAGRPTCDSEQQVASLIK